jgi:5-carboxymethyl-2-hydroxymuconate isomerase
MKAVEKARAERDLSLNSRTAVPSAPLGSWKRIGRCVLEGRPRFIVYVESEWYALPVELTNPFSVSPNCLRAGFHGPRLCEEALEWLTPIEPRQVIGVGLNYRSHAVEVGAAIPKNPLLFVKLNSSLIGHGATISVDEAVTQAADWEVELAVIVGRPLRRASRLEAREAVFGYTVANDVTARDIQTADVQWTRSKNLDTFGPLGPWIVPSYAIDAGHVKLRASVNGVPMQNGTTSDMIFDVPDLLAFCSYNFTLQAGDVVLTGTPPGVGGFRKPPIYLRHGDLVEVEVEGVGQLRNVVEVVSNGARHFHFRGSSDI